MRTHGSTKFAWSKFEPPKAGPKGVVQEAQRNPCLSARIKMPGLEPGFFILILFHHCPPNRATNVPRNSNSLSATKTFSSSNLAMGIDMDNASRLPTAS